MLCDTLNVFDQQPLFPGSTYPQSADQIFLCARATCTPAGVETEKFQITGLELRISHSTDSDY